MARTDTFQNWATDVADSIRSKTGKTDKIPAASFDSEIIAIQTKENLDAELSTQNEEITEQESDLSSIMETIKLKAILGEIPEKFMGPIEWNENGFATKYKFKGMDYIPAYALALENFMTTSTSKYITDVYLENCNITSIDIFAFRYCNNLERIHNLPDTIESIRQGAFQGCTWLQLEKLPANLKGYMNEDRIFEGCSAITIKTIPDGITYMSGAMLFSNCSSITQMSMKNVTHIAGSYAANGVFYGCSKMKAIWIGSAISAEQIGRYTFNYCSSLFKIFIDLPRTTVEAMTYYSTKWSDNTVATNCQIICNDDEGWMTKEEFDAIDWSTYTG